VSPLDPGPHAELLLKAITTEARAHRDLMAGRAEAAEAGLREASERYRASWEAAPPRAFGRLIGMLKAAIIAGGGEPEAAYVRRELDGFCDSPPSCYALALAALVHGEDEVAGRAATAMREGDAPFDRAADAIAALAAGDRNAYAVAVQSIVDDFEDRDEHLTGVPIADTALMLETLAQRRGLAYGVRSPLLPAG
jgi:hypothetical protein